MSTEHSLYKLKIDGEFRRLIPSLSARERKQLEENIIQNGCRDAICVWNKTIIDGHSRYEICRQHEIPFAIKYIFLRNRDEAIAWICANQLERRDINEATRRYLIGKRYELEKIIGACSISGRNQNLTNEVYQNGAQPRLREKVLSTRDRFCIEYRIGTATVGRYALYAQAVDNLSKAVPELYQKIISGQIKIARESLVKISRLSPFEVRHVGLELLQNPNAQIAAVSSKIVPKNTSHKTQLSMIQIGAVKDMPQYDPDAEMLSLVLTIPSWIGSINRVHSSVNFLATSGSARKKAVATLNELEFAIKKMLLEIEEMTNG